MPGVEEFGTSVAIEGDTALVGAHIAITPLPVSGSAYLYDLAPIPLPGGIWLMVAALVPLGAAAMRRHGR